MYFLTKDEVDSYAVLSKTIKLKIEEIYLEMMKMKGINVSFSGNKFEVDSFYFEKDTVDFQYMDQFYDDVYRDFPIYYLYDENWKSKFEEKLKSEREAKEEERRIIQEQRQKQNEKSERKLLAELKAKYESNTQ